MVAGTNKMVGKLKGKEKQMCNDSDSDTGADFPSILRKAKVNIARTREGGKHCVRDAQADFEAAMRGTYQQDLQISIESLMKFKLQKTASAAEFSELLKLRSRYSRKVRSLDLPPKKTGAPLESSSYVTPPDRVNLYHMVEIMDGDKSILQLLFKQCNGYFQGFRPTPKVRYEKNGFFVFSDVKLPPFFGTCHNLHRTADYTCGDEVLIGDGFLGLMAEQMVEVTVKNFKNLMSYILETPMIAFGEGQRESIIEDFIVDNFEAPFKTLTSELCFYYGNWSFLSKLTLHIYLAILEVLLGFHGSHATMRQAWDLLRTAITQFERHGFQLVLSNDDGVFCLSRLIGRCGILRLLKCEDKIVRKIIIRQSHKSSAEFRETRANSKGSFAPSSESDTDDEGDDDEDAGAGFPLVEVIQKEEQDDKVLKRKYAEMADLEHTRWTQILQRGEDLMAVLMCCPEELTCRHCHH